MLDSRKGSPFAVAAVLVLVVILLHVADPSFYDEFE